MDVTSLYCEFLVGGSALAFAGGETHGTDPHLILLGQARSYAADAVKRFNGSETENESAKNWLLLHKAALMADITASPHSPDPLDGQNQCALTELTAQAVIHFSSAHCGSLNSLSVAIGFLFTNLRII